MTDAPSALRLRSGVPSLSPRTSTSTSASKSPPSTPTGLAVSRVGAGARTATLTLAVALVLSGVACGNYSNEDLEFMSALPQREDVAVEVPHRASLDSTGIAEGWKSTLDVTRIFNGVADAFLSLIEKVRSYYPTSRLPNQRIWGPFPSDENPGWRVEFRMTRLADAPTPSFAYVLVMVPPPGVILPGGAAETTIMRGSFDAASGVRVGTGQLDVTVEEARAAGASFRGLEKLRTLAIEYNTRDWPRRVTMMVHNLPPANPDTDTAEASYVYERAENGDGAMQFGFLKDVVAGPLGAPPADETLMVESRWLGSGRGRADVSVTGGDSVGSPRSLECWDERFHQTYQLQTWTNAAPLGDVDSCIARL